jgi:hypothetical protein
MARLWLFGVLAGCLAAAPVAAAPDTGSPGAASPPRLAKPAPLEFTKQHALPPPPRVPGQQATTVAPMPNRSFEGPRVVIKDRASLSPSVIRRNLPSRGLAPNGSPDELEEKLFLPAPGARLLLPFSY